MIKANKSFKMQLIVCDQSQVTINFKDDKSGDAVIMWPNLASKVYSTAVT